MTPSELEFLAAQPVEKNPCRRIFGKGPEGARCKECAHLFRKQYSKTYIKCGLRPDTNGPATDHRANWPACAQFRTKTTTPTQEAP